jgi:hypothetical protein
MVNIKVKRGQPWGFLGPRRGAKKVKFGVEKFQPKPKTPQDWHQIYLKHQFPLQGISSLRLYWNTKGPGQTGIRYFKVDFFKYFSLIINNLLKLIIYHKVF